MTLPAFLQNYQPDEQLANALSANLGSGAVPYLSIMGNRLTLVDASGDQEPVTTQDPKTGLPYLDCVVVDANHHASKIYYGKPFDTNAQSWSPPDCWSDNGVAPSVNASTPQAKSCTPDPTGENGCQLAVWGSKKSPVTGKPIPACGKYQKLAILPVTTQLAANGQLSVLDRDNIIFLVRVPPNSLDGLRAYHAKFKGQQLDIRAVITRISFEPQGLGTLTFQAVTVIDEVTFGLAEKARAQKATDALVGRGDQPRLAGPAHTSPLGAMAPGGQLQGAGPLLPAPVQTVASPSIATVPAQTQTAGPAQAASPSEQPQRRRRRTAAEMQAAAAPPAATAPQQAPFRPQPADTQPQFGISQSASAPPTALESELANIFGTP